MNHSIDFFRDEVRNGFYIPTVIKQAWAMSLDVLAEIDRICQKHNITYFADWGSFLGAVRHGGFIPWDDDLDICMKREDYTRFRQVADNELPPHYCIHDYERKEDHWLFLSRVVGNSTICFEENYLNTHYNFPWLSTVDIFVKDYLYDDEEKEKKRDKDVMFLITLADGIREGRFDKKTITYHLHETENKYRISLPNAGNVRELCVALYRLAEQQMAKVKPEETNRIGQIFPWVLKGNKGEPKKRYEKTIRLPFEDTTIPVPLYYHEALSSRYRNYNEIRKVWDGHDYPFFEGQKANLEKINGAPLPEFIFEKNMLERPAIDRSNDIKTIAAECVKELKTLFEIIKENVKDQNLNQEISTIKFEPFFTESQKLAEDLGILIEQEKGEERQCTKKVVSSLEKYCEDIYQCFKIILDINDTLRESNVGDTIGCSEKNISNILENLEESLKAVTESVEKNIIKHKEVLFLPIGPMEWCGFEKIYKEWVENAAESGETDIYVVPLPLMPKNILGQVCLSDTEIKEAIHISEYTADITYSDWQSYDVSQHCPDIIYIQFPYDERNPYLTIPPVYYAKNLRKYSEKLIFIPFKKVSEFGENDVTDMYNLKHYAVSPGVIYADTVILQSENIRKHYINALTKFAGDDTRRIWEKKVIVEEATFAPFAKEALIEDSTDDGGLSYGGTPTELFKSPGVKSIVYCIGANELSEHGPIIVNAVKNRFELFMANKEKIKCTIALYPNDRRLWSDVNSNLASELFGLIDKTVSEGIFDTFELVPKNADEQALKYDAYFGDPSPLVPAFIMQKKAVMIVDYDK